MNEWKYDINLMDKRLKKKNLGLVLINDNCSETSVCIEIERLPAYHKGKMDGEVNGTR